MGKNNSVGDHKSVLQQRPFEVVSVDTVGPFPTTPEGYKYVLTIIDNFTRYHIAVPLRDKTAKETAGAMIKHLFLAYPFWPRKILSDKGSEFNNELIHEIYKHIHVKQTLTSHDNPAANGQIERFHRYMNAAISVFANNKQKRTKWTDYLDSAVFVYRCTTNHITGYSPFFALYGKAPVRPLDFLINQNLEEHKYSTNTEYIEEILSTLTECYQDLHQNQLTQAIKNMNLNNKQDVHYNVGDLVYLWRKYKPPKIEWKYEGPYPIVEKISEISYKVQTGTYASTHPTKPSQNKFKTVTVRHLRPYNPFDDNIEDTSPSLIDASEEHKHDSPQQSQQQLSHTISPGDMTIVPYWAWYELQLEKRNWSVAKVVSIDGNNVTIHRFGSESGNYLHAQKPGYVYRNNKKQLKIRYTKQPQKLGTHIPYTNNMNDTTLDHSYTYKINKKDILFTGFTLVQDDRIPPFVLDLIENDEWINSGIHVDPKIPDRHRRRNNQH